MKITSNTSRMSINGVTLMSALGSILLRFFFMVVSWVWGGDQIPTEFGGVRSPPRLREQRMLRSFLLTAQPPLLEEEGKSTSVRLLCPLCYRRHAGVDCSRKLLPVEVLEI